MGRLIDADKLRYKHSLNTVNTTMPQSFPCITKDEINNAPTVKAIPKADYENRLKVDMESMLKELQLEIEELDPNYECNTYYAAIRDCSNLTQQKIDKLKENTDGNNY